MAVWVIIGAWTVLFIDGKVSGAAIAIVGILGGTAANALWCWIYADAERSMGGSVIVFAIIGMILVLRLTKKIDAPFRLGTWYGNWTVGYVVLGNIFNASLQIGDLSTVVMHVISFAVGAVLAGVVVLCGIM